MSEQSKVPTAAELREAAGWCEGEPLQAKLLAGAAAMERVKRLEAALRRIAVYNTSRTLAECRDIAAAALAQEGGA